LKGWFEHRKKDEVRFASQKEKGEQLVLHWTQNWTISCDDLSWHHSFYEIVWKQRVKDAAIGYESFPDDEVPPPSALAGRRVIGRVSEKEMPCGSSLKMWKSLNAKLLRKLDRNNSLEDLTKLSEGMWDYGAWRISISNLLSYKHRSHSYFLSQTLYSKSFVTTANHVAFISIRGFRLQIGAYKWSPIRSAPQSRCPAPCSETFALSHQSHKWTETFLSHHWPRAQW
jgi:hypothetical protein